MKRALASLLLLLLTAATGGEHYASWVVLGQDKPDQQLNLRSQKSIPFATFRPKALIRLSADAVLADGKVVVQRGTLMIPVDLEHRTACEIIKSHDHFFHCLSDSDGDGLFDGYFRFYIDKPYFITGTLVKSADSISLNLPLSHTEVDPRVEFQPLVLELLYDDTGGIRHIDRFKLCMSYKNPKNIFGVSTVDRYCREDDISLRRASYPTQRFFYGGSFTFLARDAEGVHVKVVYPKTDVAL